VIIEFNVYSKKDIGPS